MVESDENKLIAELVKFQLGIMEKTYQIIPKNMYDKKSIFFYLYYYIIF